MWLLPSHWACGRDQQALEHHTCEFIMYGMHIVTLRGGEGGSKPCWPLFIVATKFHTHVVLSVDSVLSRHDACTDVVISWEAPLSMVRRWDLCLAVLIRLWHKQYNEVLIFTPPNTTLQLSITICSSTKHALSLSCYTMHCRSRTHLLLTISQIVGYFPASGGHIHQSLA